MMHSHFVEAVKAVVPTLAIGHRRVLQALLFAPGNSASAGQLKTLLGLTAVVQVNSAMGYVGRKVHEALGSHPEGLAEGEYEWWHVVATGQSHKGRGFVWQLRAEVVSALLACGFSASGDAQPNEVRESVVLFEGVVRYVMVNAYERNPVARTRCIEVHGCKCAVCDFDFGAVYGAAAKGFVHVHHIKPLASIGEQYEVNPAEDLRPVCPNCHAVIHMSNPPFSIEEVRAMMSAKQPNPSLQPTVFAAPVLKLSAS